MKLAVGILTILGVVAFIVGLIALEAVVLMWLFNVVARYFEWKEITFPIAVAIVLLLNIFIGAVRKS